MSCLYCWNQPKKYGRYDLILDGKISAKDITITNGTGTDFVSLVDKINAIDSEMGFMHSYDDTYKSFNELNEAFHQRKLKEHVVYLVPNENTSSYKVNGEEVDRYEEETGRDSYKAEDKYDEYMIIKGQLELIGSGSYQRIRQDIEAITGYDILHNWDATTLNVNEDGVHTLNNRLNRDVEIFKAVTGYDYLDSKSNNEVTTESIDAKVQQIDKDDINGDNINSRLNRDREIFKAVTGYVYDDEEDNVPVTKDEIAQHVQNDGGTIKEVVSGITGYIYDKDPSKDDAEADIKTVVENITGYTFHKDSSVKTNGGNISEVVSVITGYEFNTDLTDDNNCSIKGKVEDITGYDYDTSASAQGGTVREVVSAITGYEFDKDVTTEGGNIHTRIVNEITRATTAEETLDNKIDDTKTELQKEIDADVKVETDRAELKEKELEENITILTNTITELRKNIVVLELDKGYQITAPTIESSYEEGALNNV